MFCPSAEHQRSILCIEMIKDTELCRVTSLIFCISLYIFSYRKNWVFLEEEMCKCLHLFYCVCLSQCLQHQPPFLLKPAGPGASCHLSALMCLPAVFKPFYIRLTLSCKSSLLRQVCIQSVRRGNINAPSQRVSQTDCPRLLQYIKNKYFCKYQSLYHL